MVLSNKRLTADPTTVKKKQLTPSSYTYVSWRGKLPRSSLSTPLRLYVNEKKICNYFIDFKITLADNTVELIEVKGFETDVWRLKWKLTEALLEEIEPGAKLILVK